MKIVHAMIGTALLVLAGCSSEQTAAPQASVDGTPFLLASEPADVVPVSEARQSTETDQEVTLVGCIGGSREPFVEGVAAFTIVDTSVPYCADEEGCPTPWDYCCTQDQVKGNIATIKIVDESGSPVAADARDLLGVSELSQVVVKGTAIRDDSGNLTVAATRVFIRPGK